MHIPPASHNKALHKIVPTGETIDRLSPGWLKTLALWAFGFSWFVKGVAFWADE